MNPDLAVLMLVIGGLLIYLEFNAPGTIVPGALGTLLVLLSLFALNLLPVHYTAVMLLLAAGGPDGAGSKVHQPRHTSFGRHHLPGLSA